MREGRGVLSNSCTSKTRRRAAEQRGRQAEDKAANLFQEKGYKILARRLKTGVGEIDLVVADSRVLIFVEVKARRNLIDAACAVSSRQRMRLWQAATLALACHEEWIRPIIRFDVVLIISGDIQIIENAFWLDECQPPDA